MDGRDRMNALLSVKRLVKDHWSWHERRCIDFDVADGYIPFLKARGRCRMEANHCHLIEHMEFTFREFEQRERYHRSMPHPYPASTLWIRRTDLRRQQHGEGA
jgi:hypothetical protein